MKPLIDYIPINEAFVPTISLMMMVGAVLDIGSCASYSARINIEVLDIMRNWILDDTSQKILSKLNDDKDIKSLRFNPRYMQDKEWKVFYDEKISEKEKEILSKAQKGLIKA